MIHSGISLVRRTLVATAGVLVASVVTLGVSAAPATAAPPAPVPRLELDRYLGVWLQLAAVPQYFNLVCARDTRAEYSLDPAGDVIVRNICTTWAGTPNQIVGTAVVNDADTGAQLHVSFPGVFGQDSRSGPTNYIVTALGPDYSWAVVTDPTRLSGFVLSRTPSLDPAAWDAVRTAIRSAGQDPCAYLTSPTTGGLETVTPVCAT